ncbi:MAG: glycoside hydrolase family 16 protein [Bacteroidota bacterium]
MIGLFRVNIFVLFALLMGFNTGSELPGPGKQGQGPRIINFSGYEWIVSRTGDRARQPGPNYFSNSPDNVWVDYRGRLHLRITNNNGRWECAGVILRGAKSYGQYTFRISTDADKLDRNIVAGLFLYRDDLNEVDIEFARWGDEGAVAGQYVVQPSDNEDNVHRFSLAEAGRRSTHVIDWRQDSIVFSSHRGHGDTGIKRDIIEKWVFEGYTKPSPDRTKVMINLWLFRGTPLADQKEAELIIDSFEAMTY